MQWIIQRVDYKHYSTTEIIITLNKEKVKKQLSNKLKELSRNEFKELLAYSIKGIKTSKLLFYDSDPVNTFLMFDGPSKNGLELFNKIIKKIEKKLNFNGSSSMNDNKEEPETLDENEIEYAVYLINPIENIPGFMGFNQHDLETFLSEYFNVPFYNKIEEFDSDVIFLSEPISAFTWDDIGMTHLLTQQSQTSFKPDRKKSIFVLDKIDLLNPDTITEEEMNWLSQYKSIEDKETADQFDRFGFFEIKRFSDF